MPLIPERERQQIRDIFDQGLVNNVRLELFTKKPSKLFVPGRQESPSGPETEELLKEVAELNDKLQLEIHDVQADPEAATRAGIERFPTLVLHGANEGTLRFLGPPTGYEFSTLVADLVDLSAGNSVLSDETKETLKSISEPVHIQVFGTPT